MNFPNLASYHFYPVGQGLFAAGSIHRYGEYVSRFFWVYDCGTSSSQTLINTSIDALDSYVNHRKQIDLLVLSHFDHDHISGVCRLLNKFKIETLLLPYMPLAQRLLVAFEEEDGNAGEPLTEFYLNPVSYLLNQDGPGITRILFVPPSGTDGPPYPTDLPTPPQSGPEDGPEINFEADKRGDDPDIDLMLQSARRPGRNTSVAFLRPGSVIAVRSCLWEFIPYNDDPQYLIEKEFTDEVNELRSSLLLVGNNEAREIALDKLKMLYDAYFGGGSKARNAISLFLYSGPVYASWHEPYWIEVWAGQDASRQLPNRLPWVPRTAWGFPIESDMARCSILYSGDGYLDSDDRLKALIGYLRPDRVRRTGVFQVMHHGAEGNWHNGVAAAIAPWFSVFCSDPGRKDWKHPHAPVLRDFWRYNPIQVDKASSFTLRIKWH